MGWIKILLVLFCLGRERETEGEESEEAKHVLYNVLYFILLL